MIFSLKFQKISFVMLSVELRLSSIGYKGQGMGFKVSVRLIFTALIENCLCLTGVHSPNSSVSEVSAIRALSLKDAMSMSLVCTLLFKSVGMLLDRVTEYSGCYSSGRGIFIKNADVR